MSKKTARRLGRGLDSLVSDLRAEIPPAPGEDGTPPAQALVAPPGEQGYELSPGVLSTSLLKPNPFQPRSNIAEGDVLSLAQSIKQNGMLQPIVVRKREGQFEIIAGERRWRAAQSLGLKDVPVILREADDREMLELALIENIQREDLNPIDRARAYRSYITQFDLKAEQLAERLGEDRTTVVNYLRLLDLSSSVQELVAAQKLSMGHARCLLGISDEARRLSLAETVMGNALSVRALEEIVRREKGARDSQAKPVEPKSRSAHIRDMERRFEEAVKTRVTIREGKRKGTGRIIIDYYSLDDFDHISSMLGLVDE